MNQQVELTFHDCDLYQSFVVTILFLLEMMLGYTIVYSMLSVSTCGRWKELVYSTNHRRKDASIFGLWDGDMLTCACGFGVHLRRGFVSDTEMVACCTANAEILYVLNNSRAG